MIMKSISRIDQPHKNHHGYYVRVVFRGKQHSKFFGDRKHGGEEAALDAAIKYRNELEAELGKPRTDRVVVAPADKDRGGIRRYQKPTRRNGKVHYSDVYEVSWCPEPGQVKRKRFYVGKLGEREAKRRAHEFRRMQERRMYGEPIKAVKTSGPGEPPSHDS
jgi:hypothetical protein